MAIRHETLGEIGDVTIRLAETTLAARFTEAEIAAAFDLITTGMANWKGQISTRIPATLRDVAAAAIEYYTGSEASFEPEGESGAYLRVRAPGYYAAGA